MLGIRCVCTPRMHSHLPFSTREVLATISSPLRVCLTPWSVFQDGWRHPIPFANIEHHGEATDSPVRVSKALSPPISPVPSFLHLFAGRGNPKVVPPDNAARLVLAVEMEALPLSLSRLQVLCHSLSKVLFKLSLTLLVRYRSSYSVFNFGRHIPAD